MRLPRLFYAVRDMHAAFEFQILAGELMSLTMIAPSTTDPDHIRICLDAYPEDTRPCLTDLSLN